MQLAVLGAGGRTGRLVVEEALRRGHGVRALVRSRARAALPPGVEVVEGDARSADALAELVAGADAVVSALGPSGKDPSLHREVSPLLVAAMDRAGVTRVVTIAGAGADLPGDRKGPVDRTMSWLMHRVGGGMAQDKEAERAVLAASQLEWTQARPPMLHDGPGKGLAAVRADAVRPVGPRLSRADLAAWLVDEAESRRFVRQSPFVAA